MRMAWWGIVGQNSAREGTRFQRLEPLMTEPVKLEIFSDYV
jgi:hypothetical protein